MSPKILVPLLSLMLLINACSSDDSGTTPLTDDELFQMKLQSIIDEKIGTDEDKLVGVSISIRVAGEEKWSLTGGLSKLGEPISSDMRFGVGSITKTTVAATIMKLQEEGLLSIEDPISKWLTLNNPNIDPSITIFQLLNHLSGVKGYFHHPDIWPTVEANLSTPIAPEAVVDYIGEPVFQPGDQYQYSNSNYHLLGLIIEAASGQSVGEAMRTRFWGPLQLDHIYFGDDESPTGPIATPWRDSDGNGTLEDITAEYQPAYHSVFWCAADVFSTASDLSMWAHELFAGSAIKESTRDQMLTFVQIGDPIATGYGLGIRRVILGERTTWGHTGGMRGYGSYMFYEPNTQVSIAMLNNQSRSANGPLLRYQLVDEILTEVFKEVK